MSSLLAYVDLTLAGYVAVFVATLVFSQKIKDFLKGVPAHSRASMSQIEAAVFAQVKTYEHELVSKLIPTPVTVAVNPAPAAPAPAGPAA